MSITRTKIFPVQGQSPIVLHNVPQSVELVGDITWKDEEQTIIDDFTAKIKTKDEYSTGVPYKVIKRVDTLNTTSKTWTEGTQETYEAQEEEFTLSYKGHERDFEVTFDEEGTPVIRYRWSMNDAHDLTIGGGGASVEILPLGGKIFYIDSTDNGATYRFYKEDDSEIEGWTDIASLADAVSYSVEGEPTADKFYVYYPTMFNNLQWGYYDTQIGTGTDIGTGKTNTATVMARTDIPNPSIWSKLSEIRTSSEIDDWFVPSREELIALKNFKESIFQGNTTSSTEHSKNVRRYCACWSVIANVVAYSEKTDATNNVFFTRSF